VAISLHASIFVNYKIQKSRLSSTEKSEEASFDTDGRSFIEEAAVLIDLLDNYVKNARTARRT
jgi:hypothetical protein